MSSPKTGPRPSVSILSAVWNEALYLTEMIESVKEQTLENWELLIVDDGSDDESAAIATHYAEQDPRIKVISEGRKLGKTAAYNLAFESSCGDVIVLLAGDDRIPPSSLAIRFSAVNSGGSAERIAAFFRLRTFSTKPSLDGMVLPRTGSSRSGGAMALSRGLAAVVFPIDEQLVSEDLWIAEVIPVYAEAVVEVSEVVLEYRIHEGNSNPRGKPFEEMSVAMAQRHEAWRLVLERFGKELRDEHRARLTVMYRAELLRREGRSFAILRLSSLPIADRLAMISMSRPFLFAVRKRLYRVLAGRRRG